MVSLWLKRAHIGTAFSRDKQFVDHYKGNYPNIGMGNVSGTFFRTFSISEAGLL